MIKNGEIETVRFEVTKAARNNKVRDRRIVFNVKKLMTSVYNETSYKHSSTSHVCQVLVCLTNYLLTSMPFFL